MDNELDKWKNSELERNVIDEFLYWIQQEGYTLYNFEKKEAFNGSYGDLTAKFLKIDLSLLDKERGQLILELKN